MKTPGQIAFEACETQLANTGGGDAMKTAWVVLPVYLQGGWEAAAKAVMEAGANIDGNIRRVVEQALKDVNADRTIVPGGDTAWHGAYLGSVEWAIGDDGDITRRVYIERTYESPGFREWLQNRLKAEVENGDNIQIVMEW